jgi:hypothetical protein
VLINEHDSWALARGFFMKRCFLCIPVVCLIVLALPIRQAWADPDDMKSYVLTAGHWGAKQDAAVFRAGGTVVFSHGKSGIGVVESASPDFAALASASKAFTTVSKTRSSKVTDHLR